MGGNSSNCCTVQTTGSVLLLIVALLLFLLTIALGVAGIVVATQGNICVGERIHDDCIPVESDELPADANVTAVEDDLPLLVSNIRDTQHYLYWMTGATLCGLLFVFIGSVCVWIAARICSNEKGKKVTKPQQLEEQKVGDAVLIGEQVEMKIQGFVKSHQEDQVYTVGGGFYELVKQKDEDLSLQEPGIKSFIGIFLFFLFGILSIISMLWAFGIAHNRFRRSEDSVIPFVLANILAGITSPVLFFASIFIGLKFFVYYTNGKVKQHLILTKLLPCAKYEEGKSDNYWVLGGSLLLTCKDKHKNDDGWSSLFPNSSTTLLCFIIALNMMVSFSYFIDITLVNQVSVDSCSDSNINIQYSCFRANSLSPVDCTSNNATQPLHCFRFYEFGVDINLITSASSAFFFYLFTSRILDFIILLMKLTSISKQKLKLQGAIFVALFGMFCIMTITVAIMWLTGVTSKTVSLLAHLDILDLAQLMMFSLYFLYVGLLAQEGEWIQKRPARTKKVTFFPTKKAINKDTSIMYANMNI